MTKGRAMRAALGAAAAFLTLIGSAVGQQADQIVPVGTVAAERKPIAKTADFVGRVQAVNRVEVQARAR